MHRAEHGDEHAKTDAVAPVQQRDQYKKIDGAFERQQHHVVRLHPVYALGSINKDFK
jgi:hypothetical protein